MNLRILLSCARSVTLVAALSYTTATVSAVSLPATPQITAAGDQENQYQFVRRGPEADMLREAYDILARADHDYKGHRAKAMHEIEEAGKLIGMNLRGEGHGRERQAVSDTQLHHAQDLLEQVRNNVVGQKKVHNRVEAAIKQLSIALSIK
jgi:hypothetical protein